MSHITIDNKTEKNGLFNKVGEFMYIQSYYHPEYGVESNVENTSVPFQVNCSGEVSFSNKHRSLGDIRHDFYFLYLLSGNLHINDESLFPGDVIIIEPEHFYTCTSKASFNYLWVHYTGSEAHSFSESVFGEFGRKKHIGIRLDICDLFKRLHREFIINDKNSENISICLLKEILSLTGRYIESFSENIAPLASIEYIHKHYSEEISVKELCDIEHLSPTSFRIMFKKHTGTSPNEYIILQRVNAACTLLKQTDISIRDVAKKVGYADPYYFSRIFHSKMGVSPSTYRSENKR